MIIADELTYPYIIRIEKDDTYTLYEEGIIQSGKNEGARAERIIGYYTTLENVLRKIVRLKCYSATLQYTIEDYIQRLEQMSSKFGENFSLTES